MTLTLTHEHANDITNHEYRLLVVDQSIHDLICERHSCEERRNVVHQQFCLNNQVLSKTASPPARPTCSADDTSSPQPRCLGRTLLGVVLLLSVSRTLSSALETLVSRIVVRVTGAGGCVASAHLPGLHARARKHERPRHSS